MPPSRASTAFSLDVRTAPSNGANSPRSRAPGAPGPSPPSPSTSDSDTALHDVPLGPDPELGGLKDTKTALQGLEPVSESRKVTIEVSGLSAYAHTSLGRPPLWRRLFTRRVGASSDKTSISSPQEKQILFDVTVRARPSELTALMGPSGSGKTTLLSLIGGRAPRSLRRSGAVLFNGRTPGTSAASRRGIGFVLQDDLLYESLTVYETLYFAAMLRLPRSMSKADKLRRVDDVIAALGLVSCRETIIGGFMRRGISGGERKRCSVGHELVLDPPVLLLDEPTSGLDSTAALRLLGTLASLAHTGGHTVIATLHQPSSRIFQQLDKLILLSGGRVCFYGAAAAAGDYCAAAGFPPPPHVGIADFLLDLASGEAGEGEKGDAARRRMVALAEGLQGPDAPDGFDPASDTLVFDRLRALAARGDTASMRARALAADLPGLPSQRIISLARVSSGDDAVNSPTAVAVAAFGGRTAFIEEVSATTATAPEQEGEDTLGAPFWAQVGLLFRRSLRTRRFETLSTQDITQFTVIAVLAGLFWLQRGESRSLRGAQDTLGVLFFIVMFLSFRSMFTALFTFPTEQRHMLKERASGMYRLSAFYMARLLSDFPMDVSIPTGFIIVVYWMAGLRPTAAAFFGTYFVLLLAMFVAQSLGLLLGSYFMNPKTAQAVASCLMLAFTLTGGFFVTGIADWISWIRWLSYIFYALGVLLYVQWHGVTYYSCTSSTTVDGTVGAGQCVQTSPSDPQTDPACAPISDLQAALGLMQNPASQGDAVRDGMVLLAFLVVLRAVGFWVLRRKTRGF